MAWVSSLLGGSGAAGAGAATTASGLTSALKTSQSLQNLANPGQQAAGQAAAAGQAEAQKGMQFANAGSGQPQLQQFATQTTPISSGTYNPVSQLDRFRMYQGGR